MYLEIRNEQWEIIEQQEALTGFVSFPFGHNPAGLHLLQYLDPYGTAIFNKLQMDDLLADLSAVRHSSIEDRDLRSLSIAQRMALKCKEGGGLLLVFLGD